MRSHPIRIALPAAAVTCLALAACGGGEADPAGSSDREKLQEAALEHAECMRRQGIDVPDPKPGEGVLFRADGVDPERLEQAQEKCEEEVGALPAPQMSEQDKREFREAALAHARCMREQGIDFPDPTFGPNGSVRIELEGGLAPDDPAFQAAEKKCSEHLPGPRQAPLGAGR